MATQRAVSTKRTKIYTLEDVSAHAKLDDLWVIHDNKIYDVSAAVHAWEQRREGGSACFPKGQPLGV